MDFAFDARTEELRARLLAFMDDYVHPAEALAREQRARLASPWDTPAVVEELKAEARRQGLWNLFLPDSVYGAGSPTSSTPRSPRSPAAPRSWRRPR